MKKVLFLLTAFLISNFTFGQTYEGYSLDDLKSYHCLFRVNSDSTVNYTYNRKRNGVYAEYFGKIRKTNDSIYAVKAHLLIGQSIMKTFSADTLYIQLDLSVARQLDKIELEYSNKEDREYLKGYDDSGKPIRLLKIPVNKELFNEKEGTNYVTITVNRTNRITGEWPSFKIPYGSAASITRGHEINFKIVINNRILKTVENWPVQTGHIKLEEIKPLVSKL